MTLPLTVGNRLRKEYFVCPPTRQDHSLDEYIEELKRLGVWMHPALKPAFFRLNNGLEYPGLMTTEDLHGGELLVKVPKDLLLSTAVALRQPVLKKLYQQPFYKKALYWQHRILITYLLWTYQEERGVWYHMVRSMSRDVDLLCLWTDQDAKYVADPKCYRASRGDHASFIQQWEEFAKLMTRYNIIHPKYVTLDNYRWLYAHLFSRCFGRSECLTLVPYCQLFNHHISRIFYDVEYLPGNPNKYLESKWDKQTSREDEELSSSNETDKSYDYEDEADWDYSEVPIEAVCWGPKLDEKLNQKERHTLELARKEVRTFLATSIDWNDGSVLFAGQLLQQSNLLYSEFVAGRLQFSSAAEGMSLLKQQASLYRQLIVRFNELYRSKRWRYTIHNDNRPKKGGEGVTEYPNYPPDKFDFFVMRLNYKDRFSKGNQVYFRYGRLSSRKMLECYGMAIEGNKYEHIWVHIDLLPLLKDYPDILLEMRDRCLSHKQKFKLKRREFSMEIMFFSRLVRWRYKRDSVKGLFNPTDLGRELEAIAYYRELMETLLKNYPAKKVLEAQLTDKQTGYHQYFGVVYQLEKVRVLQLHLRMLAIAVRVIGKFREGLPLKVAAAPTAEEKQEYWLLRSYFNCLPDQPLA